MRLILTLATFLLIAVYSPISAGAAPADAAVESGEFIFLSELQPGMEGYALTVIDGIRIDRIQLSLIGIIKDRCFNGRDMLLLRTWGDVVDYTHGVAGGMSGSPIYFDGRLAGAISGHWLHTDQRVAIGTPVEYMLENFGYEDSYSDSYDDPLPYGNPFFNEQQEGSSGRIAIAANDDEAAQLQTQMGPDGMVFVKAATPIVVGGLEPAIVEVMREDLECAFGGEILDIPVTLPANVQIPEILEPGAVLATMWSRGDIQYGSYGTVTYVSADGRVLGFGHDMGRRGRTEVPMAYGYIYGRRPGVRKSNKYGGPTKACGVITQDRGGAISGYFGIEPRFVPVRVAASINGGPNREYLSEVTGSRFYFPIVCAAVARASILRAAPQYLRGVLNVDWRVQFEGGETISRHDVYGGNDPVSAFSDDLSQATSWCVENRFRRLVPESVTIRADFNPVDNHLRIIEAKLVDDDTGLVFSPETREVMLVDEDGAELARAPYIGRQRDVKLKKEDDVYIFEPGDAIFVHVAAKGKFDNERHFLFRLVMPSADAGESGSIQVRGGGDLLPGPELIGPKAYDKAAGESGDVLRFPSFIESVESKLAEVNERFPSGALVVEGIFESIKDVENLEEASGLYVAKTEEFDIPVMGVVRIPFKIADDGEANDD